MIKVTHLAHCIQLGTVHTSFLDPSMDTVKNSMVCHTFVFGTESVYVWQIDEHSLNKTVCTIVLYGLTAVYIRVPLLMVSQQIPVMEPKMKCKPTLIRFYIVYVNLAKYLVLANLVRDHNKCLYQQ